MNQISKPVTAGLPIYAALVAAQQQMGKALKDTNNPQFKSKYADLGSVMDACMPALNASGFAVVQPTVDDENGRYVETILLHESGESLKCRVPLIVQKNDMQGYGSAVTYARRYGLMCMAGIAPEDDDGIAATKAAPDMKAEHEVAVASALKAISRETDMEGLAAYWADLYKTRRAIADDTRVIAAKNKRKDDLKLADKADADLGGDEIPY